LVKIVPYITVSDARKTIEVYKDLSGATLVDHMPFTKEVGQGFGFPDDFDYENSTMHASINIDGALIYLSDGAGKVGGIVEIVLDYESREQVEEVWDKVKKAGYEIKMELEPQFWGAIYGRFVDADGVGWQLNHNLPQ
jgi:uncharacterized glyoxalase superfamily protein PhnB